MAQKKDLAQAQNYSRQRLVTAFMSGIPQGKELAPKHTLLPIGIGIALTIIAVLTNLFYGTLNPSLPTDWSHHKVIIAKHSAARYMSVQGTLHPIINTVSARLLIAPHEYKVITVDDTQLQHLPIGATIGILGAPDALPDQRSLISGSLTSCVHEKELHNTLAQTSPTTHNNNQAVVAATAHITTLIHGSQRHQLPADRIMRDSFLRALGLAHAPIIQTPIQWINLFEQGSDITGLHVPHENSVITVQGRDYIVGSVLKQHHDDNTYYVVMQDASLVTLNHFEYQLYALDKHGALGTTYPVTVEQLQHFTNSSTRIIPQDWATQALQAMPEHVIPCATLPLSTNQKVQLITQEDSEQINTHTHSPSHLHMNGGTGALLRATIGTTTDYGTVYIVDITGTAYPIDNASEATLQRLGYTLQDVRPVMRPWIDLFTMGVTLNEQAAGSPPSQPPQYSDTDRVATHQATANQAIAY